MKTDLEIGIDEPHNTVELRGIDLQVAFEQICHMEPIASLLSERRQALSTVSSEEFDRRGTLLMALIQYTRGSSTSR